MKLSCHLGLWLLQLSVAAEQMFSLLSNSLKDTRHSSLDDYDLHIHDGFVFIDMVSIILIDIRSSSIKE